MSTLHRFLKQQIKVVMNDFLSKQQMNLRLVGYKYT